jgi:hypothetical protein
VAQGTLWKKSPLFKKWHTVDNFSINYKREFIPARFTQSSNQRHIFMEYSRIFYVIIRDNSVAILISA